MAGDLSGDIQGEFEHRVLLAAARLGEDEAFTSRVVVELEERTGREVSPAAVYIALTRLEKKGLVASVLRTGQEDGATRERRFFAPTREGLAALRESRSSLLRLWEGLDAVVAEEGR